VEDSVVWLLDEPTTGLDESSRDAVIRLIQRKAEEGGIIVVVSHDPAFLSAVSHRVVTLKAGRISVDGAGEVS
jgi:ABC-type multidrug transport system ATPase subunit